MEHLSGDAELLERGRGLAIVAALAQSSGVRASQAGKTSWFTLALTERAHRAAQFASSQVNGGGGGI